MLPSVMPLHRCHVSLYEGLKTSRAVLLCDMWCIPPLQDLRPTEHKSTIHNESANN